jgi:cysteinyl-tRNA synthetase
VTLRLYNTMVRAKEDFVPREEGRVFLYTCGPTVYNHIHIGNARTFLSFDVIRRYLEYRGYDVRFVQNITDVDDKIIRAANEEGVEAAEVARRYADAFLKAMADLGVKRPSAQPRATETIPQMIEMILRLIERGHGYVVDGDVYFSVRSFPGYGKLSGRDIDELEIGARVAADERKGDPLDFALWKSAKPGEPHWPSPWGEGRPGWHIECSVMSEQELGLPFDIHGGATDLIFPHHENELAQSEAATGKQFARYWMHGGLLQVNAEKMSKSLGNFVLLKDVLSSYPASVVRFLMLQTHYRSPLEFSTERLDEAAVALERIANTVRNLHWARTNAAPTGAAPETDRAALAAAVVEARARFEADMDDDFNTASALAAGFELARQANTFLAAAKSGLAREDQVLLAAAEAEIIELLSVLGVTLLADAGQAEYPPEVVAIARDLAGYAGSDPSAAVDALLAARSVARSERNWSAADVVRDSLARLGFAIEDTADGARVVYRAAG